MEAALPKEASFDFACAHTENRGIYGYDLVTRLGSTLSFTCQTAALAHTEQIAIVRQNFGFDLAAGLTSVPLAPDQEHYYLEVRRIKYRGIPRRSRGIPLYVLYASFRLGRMKSHSDTPLRITSCSRHLGWKPRD